MNCKSIFYARFSVTIILWVLIPAVLKAWPAHPLIAKAALGQHYHWKKVKTVEARSLQQFVLDNREALESFLAAHEQWSINNLPHYVAAPASLAFTSDVGEDNALLRFFMAIRVNPHSKVPLYLYIPPGMKSEFSEIDPSEVTTLNNLAGMTPGTFVALKPGLQVDPFLVLITANDEPDYGFDLGLFEDNLSDYGKIYGFGNQTFGNPNLEYSSQAPFHMGFYHEAGIVFKFAPFLHKTFLDYRFNLYKALSAFAFQQNEPYWGYRFLGWSMHYLADATMPYHIRPLPGYSTGRMLWINLKNMLGFGSAQRNAVQLVSNRHTAVEDYIQQRLVSIYQKEQFDDALYLALASDTARFDIGPDFISKNASKVAFDASRSFDKAVRRGLPNEMVNDPKVEVTQHPRIREIMLYTNETVNPRHIEALEKQTAARFRYLGATLRSLLDKIDPGALKIKEEAQPLEPFLKSVY